MKSNLFKILFCALITVVSNTTFAGSGFEPVISGIINDVIGETVSRDTINKTSVRITQLADIYHDAKAVPELPNTIRDSLGTPTPRKNYSSAAAKVKSPQKATTWQKIDKLILKMQNSNN